MKPFKIRCSAISKIMTNARSKSEVLGDTAKSYVQNYLLEQLYDRKIDFNSRFTDKGNRAEDLSITLLSLHLNADIAKNTQRFQDDSDMVGTPDIIVNGEVWDIKNAYTFETMPLFSTLKSEYEWQMQGYMELTGCKSAKVIYTLIDATEDEILREARSMAKIHKGDPDNYLDFCRQKMTYGDIPMHLRIKVFEVAYDPAKIAAIRQRVAECREYYSMLQNQLPCNP